VTEKDACRASSVTHGSRGLCMWLAPWNANGETARFHMATYATNRNEVNEWKNLEFSREELEGSWNFVYFGYSMDSQNAFAYVKFGKTGVIKTLDWT